MKLFNCFKTRAAIRAVTIVGFAGLVAACGIDLNPAEKARLFQLEPKVGSIPQAPMSPSQLVIAVPATSRSLDTDRIAVRKGDFEVSYYSGVRWADRAPRLIQNYLLESFETSGRITAVGRRAVGLDGNYALQGELWDFQVEMPAGSRTPDVVVAFNAKLIEQPAARIISSKTFKRRITIPSEKFKDIVEGFNEALGDILPEMTVWTLTDMEAHRERKLRERENMMQEIDNEAADAATAVRIDLDDALDTASDDERGDAEADQTVPASSDRQ